MKALKIAVKDFAEEFELAIRIAMLIFSLSFGMVVLLVGVSKANAAALRPDSVISGDYIRLGDIFEGVKNADYVLGPAPQPGKEMILNARTLYRIATALNVEWQPGSTAEQVVLRREAVVIPQAEITESLQKKIGSSGVDTHFDITYTSTMNDLVLPAGTPETLEISAFKFDQQNDTFNAVIVAPSADQPKARMNISGRIERLTQVPVLKNTLKEGDIIGANDIDYIELPQHKLATSTILDEKDLINMTPRRIAAGGKPVLFNDLEKPTMVERGDAITLIFDNGPMTLTVKGKAMQGGAMGDMVRVSNTDSNKSIQGEVTASREVTIR